jgi:hypothetical protein
MPNESLIHADIFFFVTTIALVVLSIGFAICLYYGIKILKNVKEMSDKIHAESDEILSDVKKLRGALRDEGIKWKHVADLARNFFIRKGKKAKEIAEDITHNNK